MGVDHTSLISGHPLRSNVFLPVSLYISTLFQSQDRGSNALATTPWSGWPEDKTSR